MSLRSLLQRPTALPLALALYLMLVLSVQGMGVVGEVAASWTRGPPPRVAVALDAGRVTWSGPGPGAHAGHALGPLRASQSRPTERLELAGAWLPLAVNSYTGGVADWPARLVHGATGSRHAVLALHVLLGAGLLVMLGRFLQRHGWVDAPGVAMLVLASDWCFLFYRRVLGGTELLLLCAGLLLLWGFWRGRWSGRDGSLLVGLGLGLGVLAKVTFLPTALALGLAALITRWDRPTGARSARLRWGLVLGIAAVCSAPLWIALLHSSALPDTPRLWSHDGLALQLTRLQHGLGALVSGGGSGAAREVPASLAWFFFEPLRWFAPALDAEPVGWGWAWLRGLGWLIVLAGVALTWLGRPWRAASRDRHEALLRFLSVAVPLQLALLWFANRDLHHLAQATPTVALLAGLAIERVAQRFSAPNSVRRAGLALLLCLPLVVAGGASVVRTKAVVESVPALAITEPGQRALLDLLAEHRVRRLWTSDYDLYGVFELRQPELALSHAWGAASVTHDRPALLAELLRAARGGHYLAVRPAAARIYDLAPGDADVQRAALEAGVEAVLVDEIEGPGWARLYSVAGR